MNIKILDRRSLGADTPFDELNTLGSVTVYDTTDGNQIIERLADADIVIINKIKMTEQVISSAEKLKLICVFATGYDNVDIAAAQKHGVAVCNVPAYSTDSVALLTVATTLALYSHLKEYASFVDSGEYTESGIPNRLTPVYHELRGKKWGIVGYGNIGKAVASIACAFGAEVLVCKRTSVSGIRCVDIDTLCRESDIITLHCPLNAASRNLINEERINLMKRDAVLVNEARGAVVDEAAVAAAILDGRIGAFGCDVYSKEPFDKSHPYYRLLGKDNVILTPHAAWGAYEARERCIGIICNNIRAFLNGETLNRVDKMQQK